MGLRPGYVVDAVGGVVGGELRDWEGWVWGELEDVDAAVAQDAEVLGGGDGHAVLIEGAELHGVSVEWGFENRHRRLIWIGLIWTGLVWVKECVCVCVTVSVVLCGYSSLRFVICLWVSV